VRAALDQADKGGAGELAALVGIQNRREATVPDRGLERVKTEVRGQTGREAPR